MGEWFGWQLAQLASRAHLQRQDAAVLGLRGRPRPLAGSGEVGVGSAHPTADTAEHYDLAALETLEGEGNAAGARVFPAAHRPSDDVLTDGLVFLLAATLPVGVGVLLLGLRRRRMPYSGIRAASAELESARANDVDARPSARQPGSTRELAPYYRPVN